MAVYTSAGSGNWNVAATWSQAAIPGPGDTVTINSGHVVTVTANQTVGASTASDTTAAVSIAGSGQLSIASGVTFTCAGDCTFSTAFLGSNYVVMNAGANWVWSVGSGKYYRAGGATNTATSIFAINGTLGSPCSVSVSGAGGACFSFDSIATGSYSGGGSLVASHCTFTGLGDSTHCAINIRYASYGAGTTIFNVQNCKFSSCGAISDQGVYWNDGSTVIHANNSHVGSTDANGCCLHLSFSNANTFTSGTRNIVGNVFDGILGNWRGLSVPVFGATISENYFGGGLVLQSQPWANFANNLCVLNLTNDFTVSNAAANCFFYIGTNSNNPHYCDLAPNNGSFNITGCLFETSSTSGGQGDSILSNPSTSSPAAAFGISNNIVLPSIAGQSSGSLLTLFGGSVNQTFSVNHNTYNGAQGETMVNFESAGGFWTTGQLTSFKNNIMTAPYLAGTNWKCRQVDYGTPPTTDIVSPTNADYNCGWNCDPGTEDSNLTNSGNGYSAKFSTTPGAHDLTANPMFKDSTRCIETFGSAYLGNTAGAWATSTAYTVGQIVSNVVAGSFQGATVLYRCTVAHTSGSTTIPGDASGVATWWGVWEPASLYYIRQALAAGSTYTGFGVTAGSAIDILNAWVKDGYAPTNAALHSAGSDGSDIGAVAWQLLLHAYSQALAEVFAVGESFNKKAGKAFSESVSLVESFGKSAGKWLNETFSLSELLTRLKNGVLVGGSQLAVSVSDAFTVVDGSLFKTIGKSVSETLFFFDSFFQFYTPKTVIAVSPLVGIASPGGIIYADAKRAAAVEDFVFDWSSVLTGGDTITASLWAVSPSGALAVVQSSNTTTTATVRLGAGVRKQTYRVSNTVTLASGQTKIQEMSLPVD